MWQMEAEVGEDPIGWGRCGGLPGRGRLGMTVKVTFIHTFMLLVHIY